MWQVGGHSTLSVPTYWALTARAWQENQLRRLWAPPQDSYMKIEQTRQIHNEKLNTSGTLKQDNANG